MLKEQAEQESQLNVSLAKLLAIHWNGQVVRRLCLLTFPYLVLKSQRHNGISEKVDKRTSGYKR